MRCRDCVGVGAGAGAGAGAGVAVVRVRLKLCDADTILPRMISSRVRRFEEQCEVFPINGKHDTTPVPISLYWYRWFYFVLRGKTKQNKTKQNETKSIVRPLGWYCEPIVSSTVLDP